MSLTKATFSMISGAPISILDYGAVGDGVTDCTTAIQNALNAASGVASVYFPAGTYMVHGETMISGNTGKVGIHVPSNSDLIFSDNATIKQFPTTSDVYNVLCVYNVSNVNINGGVLYGDVATHVLPGTGFNGIGLRIQGSTNVNVSGMTMTKMYTDGIAIVYDDLNSPYPNCKNVNIYDCTVTYNYRNGVSVIGCEGGTISGGLISHNGGTAPNCGIDIEPNGTSVYLPSPSAVVNFSVVNVEIANNIGLGLSLYASGTNPNQGIIDSIAIETNKIHDNGAGAINVFQSVNINIASNVLDNNAGTGIVIDSSKRCLVSNNQVTTSSTFGIQLTTATSAITVDDISVVGNQVNASAGAGIYVDGTFTPLSDIVIANNSVISSGNNGLDLNNITRGTIVGNSINRSSQNTDNTSDNIYVNNSNYLTIAENNLYRGSGGKQSRYGVVLGSGVSDSSVIDNMMYQSGKTGSISDAGTRNTIGRNKIAQSVLRGTLTLSAASATTVTNGNVLATSIIVLTPANAAAATLQQGANAVYVSALNSGTSFVLTTAGGGSATGTEQFYYSIE